jgi:hypothetical protein
MPAAPVPVFDGTFGHSQLSTLPARCKYGICQSGLLCTAEMLKHPGCLRVLTGVLKCLLLHLLSPVHWQCNKHCWCFVPTEAKSGMNYSRALLLSFPFCSTADSTTPWTVGQTQLRLDKLTCPGLAEVGSCAVTCPSCTDAACASEGHTAGPCYPVVYEARPAGAAG